MNADVDPVALSRLEEQARRNELWGDIREQYGYPRVGPPLTMEEQKAGEWRNCQLVTADAVAAHRGKHDLDSFTRPFYSRATATRDAPFFVGACVHAGCFTEEVAVEAVAWSWSMPEWPEGNFGKPFWLRLFGAVGYLHHDRADDLTRTPPETVPDLWRGAISSRRKGLAWTADRERAEWFAQRWEAGGHFKQLHLWHLPAGAVEPRRVLARFDGRGEAEWVIDTRRLTPAIVVGATKEGPTA